MLRLVCLMISWRLPLRCITRIIRHGIPVLLLPLSLKCRVSLSADELLGLPVQHEILRRPVLEMEAEWDILVTASFEERDLLVLGSVNGIQLLARETETGRRYGVEMIKYGELDLGREIGYVRS